MAQDIRHQGIVNYIDGQNVTVQITQLSACGGCQARNICRAAESKEKLIEVRYPQAGGLRVGQEVTIAGAESLGFKAVAFAFGLPLLFLMMVLVGVFAFTGSEKIAAISALGVLVPYYTVLFLFRDKLKKEFQFMIIQ